MPQCTYNTEEDIASTSMVEAHLRLLSFHVDTTHPMPPLTTNQPMPVNTSTVKTADPKPQLKDGFVSEEQWNFLTHSWQQYKSAANMDGSEKDRLGACLGDMVATKIFAKLGDRIYKELVEVEMMQERGSWWSRPGTGWPPGSSLELWCSGWMKRSPPSGRG